MNLFQKLCCRDKFLFLFVIKVLYFAYNITDYEKNRLYKIFYRINNKKILEIFDIYTLMIKMKFFRTDI